MYKYKFYYNILTMSNFEKQNENEGQDAYQEYEKEMSSTTPVHTQENQEHQPQDPRPEVNGKRWVWDEKWRNWTWLDYHSLPSQYKEFLPQEPTRSKTFPNAKEPIVHEDPFLHKKMRYDVFFFPNGGSKISAREYREYSSTSGGGSSSGGGGGFKKSFYLDVDMEELDIAEARSRLASNEGETTYRYKPAGSHVVSVKAGAPDGTFSIVNKLVHIIVKQKRIEFGGY